MRDYKEASKIVDVPWRLLKVLDRNVKLDVTPAFVSEVCFRYGVAPRPISYTSVRSICLGHLVGKNLSKDSFLDFSVRLAIRKFFPDQEDLAEDVWEEYKKEVLLHNTLSILYVNDIRQTLRQPIELEKNVISTYTLKPLKSHQDENNSIFSFYNNGERLLLKSLRIIDDSKLYVEL